MKRKILLLAVTGAACLFLVEVLGRLVVPTPPGPRSLLFSQPPWAWDPRGFVRFAPDTAIRTAAVYDDTIEYDVEFATNADGFVDDRDYAPDPGRRNVAVLGDSFTAGYHGGDAWVPRLREAPGFDPASDQLLNFGVSGTGLQNFERILAAYDPTYSFEDILILAIRSDFDRPTWKPLTREGQVFLCETGESIPDCLRAPARILLFDAESSPAEVRRAVALAHGARDASPWRRFVDTSVLLNGIRALRNRTGRDLTPGFDALARMRQRHPTARIQLLHLPQKDEVRSGTFASLRQPTEAAGVTYLDGAQRCGLTARDFFPADGHPNASGYEKIRACTADALGWNRPESTTREADPGAGT